MKKNEYLENPEVKSFISFLQKELPKLEVFLNIKKSRFVPNPISLKLVGLNNLIKHYLWQSVGMQRGDWQETIEKITSLKTGLQLAIYEKNEAKALGACDDILKWGGNRNKKKGAYPFLEDKSEKGELCSYLIDTKNKFTLNSAYLGNFKNIKMNAMLTKVHAFNSDDGLPIYDSRVAAAIATLVEMWRRNNNAKDGFLCSELSFPSTTVTRTVRRAFPDATHTPEVLNYDKASDLLWCEAKVKLGWLLQEVLESNKGLFEEDSLQSRMHHFEASLFMLGYDVACLNGGSSQVGYIKKNAAKTVSKQPIHSNECLPLSGKGNKIFYNGDKSSKCYSIDYSNHKFELDLGFFELLIEEFDGNSEVRLAASRSEELPEGSLGGWLESYGFDRVSGRLIQTTPIAAVLYNEGLVTWSKKGSAIYLDFSELGNQIG